MSVGDARQQYALALFDCEWCGLNHPSAYAVGACHLRYARALERVRAWLAEKAALERAGKRDRFDRVKRAHVEANSATESGTRSRHG